MYIRKKMKKILYYYKYRSQLYDVQLDVPVVISISSTFFGNDKK
jgi:hypothetical protein